MRRRSFAQGSDVGHVAHFVRLVSRLTEYNVYKIRYPSDTGSSRTSGRAYSKTGIGASPFCGVGRT